MYLLQFKLYFIFTVWYYLVWIYIYFQRCITSPLTCVYRFYFFYILPLCTPLFNLIRLKVFPKQHYVQKYYLFSYILIGIICCILIFCFFSIVIYCYNPYFLWEFAYLAEGESLQGTVYRSGSGSGSSSSAPQPGSSTPNPDINPQPSSGLGTSLTYDSRLSVEEKADFQIKWFKLNYWVSNITSGDTHSKNSFNNIRTYIQEKPIGRTNMINLIAKLYVKAGDSSLPLEFRHDIELTADKLVDFYRQN